MLEGERLIRFFVLVAPLCAFLNNIVEIRIDAHKFVSDVRRPVAKKVADIGMENLEPNFPRKRLPSRRYLAIDHCCNIQISYSHQCKAKNYDFMHLTKAFLFPRAY